MTCIRGNGLDKCEENKEEGEGLTTLESHVAALESLSCCSRACCGQKNKVSVPYAM